ncbi:MAG: hypothetical protein QNJ41_28220 [Xenococcaceae cyanobacterium MO_188.B32]|nr:hypothetical protein [Xenococcaceae cyanobacterium MO_188.B32]
MLSYQLEKYLYSDWQKDTRFYIIELCQDLWGNWLLKKTWGSVAKRDFGRSISTICIDYETGVKLYQKAQMRRLLRGYDIVSSA